MSYGEAMLGRIERRLGKRELLSVVDVASAFDVPAARVYQWVEGGLVTAMDLSSGSSNARWSIDRESVIEFARKRMAGAAVARR